MIPIRSWPVLGLLLLASLQAADFQREVRPILAKHCFKCHGPDENTRKAKLRLDERPDVEQLQQVLERIDHADPEELMPPMTAKKPLNAAQKKVLRDWVQQVSYSSALRGVQTKPMKIGGRFKPFKSH